MKKLMIIWAAVAAIALAEGCKSITVDNRGSEVAIDDNGEVVRTKDGNPVVLYKGWQVDYFQHWNWQRFDTFDASVETNGAIKVGINGYASGADTNLNALVSTSLNGVAIITEKVLAAVATQGCSVIGGAGEMALKACIEKFKAKGGNENNIQVSCKDGSCTITDGNVTEVCENCCIDCKDK